MTDWFNVAKNVLLNLNPVTQTANFLYQSGQKLNDLTGGSGGEDNLIDAIISDDPVFLSPFVKSVSLYDAGDVVGDARGSWQVPIFNPNTADAARAAWPNLKPWLIGGGIIAAALALMG